ncbi:MAG: glutaredoxin family protein [Candidatus Liptonbacteria bacterium]
MEKNKQKNVKLYSLPTCAYCNLAKRLFAKHGVIYEEIDVLGDVVIREEIRRKTGQLFVPVIEIEEEVFVGYDEKAILAALEREAA